MRHKNLKTQLLGVLKNNWQLQLIYILICLKFRFFLLNLILSTITSDFFYWSPAKEKWNKQLIKYRASFLLQVLNFGYMHFLLNVFPVEVLESHVYQFFEYISLQQKWLQEFEAGQNLGDSFQKLHYCCASEVYNNLPLQFLESGPREASSVKGESSVKKSPVFCYQISFFSLYHFWLYLYSHVCFCYCFTLLSLFLFTSNFIIISN